MKIENMPPEIVELAQQRQQECYKNNGTYYKGATMPSQDIAYMFDWSCTSEGHDFWSDINAGEYETFYKTYPKIHYQIY